MYVCMYMYVYSVGNMFFTVYFASAVDAMTKMSEVGSRQDKNVTETDAHGLICLAAQLALEVSAYNGHFLKNHKEVVWS